jgi:hypothetical protein
MFKPAALCHWPCCRCRRPCHRRRSCRRHCLHRRPCRRRCRRHHRHFHRCRRLRRRRRHSLPRTSRKSSPRLRRPLTHPSPRARHARWTGCTSRPPRLFPGSRPSHRTTLGGGGSVDRRPLEPGGNLFLRVLRVTEVLRGRTWFALPLVTGATWRTSPLFVLAHGQMEEKRELEEKQQMIEG